MAVLEIYNVNDSDGLALLLVLGLRPVTAIVLTTIFWRRLIGQHEPR